MVTFARLRAQESPLQVLERQGSEAFGKRDCVSALKNYEAAVPLATGESLADRAGLIYRRIGICKGRQGDIEGSLTAYRSGVAVSEDAKDREILTENVHGLGLALQRLGRLEEALPPAEREYLLAQKCGHPPHVVRAMWLVAALYDRTGKRRVAMQMFEQALQISRQGKDRAAMVILLDNLAMRYADTGDTSTGILLETEALHLSDPSDPPSMGNAWLNLGVIQMTAKHHREARASFNEALRLASGPESWAARQNALKHLAEIHIDQSEYTDALKLYDQSLELDRNIKRPEWESEIQSDRSEALLALGRTDQAMSAVVEAVRLAREIGSPSLLYEALVARGRVNRAKKLHADARGDFEEAVATAEAIRAEGLGDQQALRGGFQKRLPAYRLLANELIELKAPAQALRTAEQAKARVLMDLLLDGPVDERKAMSASELAQQKQLLIRLAVMNKAAARNPTPEAKFRADQAIRDEERFRRDIYTRHPELHLQSGEFEVATPMELGALLPDDRTALLEYFQTADDRIAIFVVRHGAAGGAPRVQAFTVPGNFDLEARRFRQQLANRDLDYKTQARRLYDRLLSPAASALKGADNIIVSPDGALWEIPFQALIDPTGRHLIETHRISLTPSLTALFEIHHGQMRAWKFDLLALGNPAMAGPPLPDAGREIEEIRAKYPAGSVARTGSAATIDEFRKNAPFARIIHIAAHANLNDGDPLYSSLSLTGSTDARDDGMLTAREVMSMHLNADMVILSACETGLGEARPGEGMMGMGWAFSAAGASSAVLSEWKVDSAATRDFMVTLHQRLVARRGVESRAESLRQTALERMKAPAQRHPFYWAGFILWGDGS